MLRSAWVTVGDTSPAKRGKYRKRESSEITTTPTSGPPTTSSPTAYDGAAPTVSVQFTRTAPILRHVQVPFSTLTHDLPRPCISDAREDVESQLAAARHEWMTQHAALNLEVGEEPVLVSTPRAPLLAATVEVEVAAAAAAAAAVAVAAAALDSGAGD